jgi:hypothetical protein
MPIRANHHRFQTWASGGLLALQACASPPAAREAHAPELVETAEEANALEPLHPTAEDTSLPLAVYRAAGVPELDQAWSASDYQRCLQVFVDLVRGGRGDLPRAGSARSGALFARVVDARNFAARPGAAGERASELASYLDVFPGFLKVYAPASDGVDFSVEQAELIVGLLELLKSALDGSRAYGAIDASWMSRYEQQKQVALGVVRGAGTMLAEESRYSPPVRRHLRAHLARLAPDLGRHLDPEAAHELHALVGSSAPADSEPLR